MKGLATIAVFLLFSAGAVSRLAAQEAETDQETVPITGGVIYNPITGEEEKLRDPFKSPFELEQEERAKDQQAQATLSDMDKRLAYNISELELKGIFLQATTGYWAIFQIGDDYKWWQVGEKFRDGDLVNIADGAVVFKHYVSDDPNQVRDVVKELRRGEE